MEGELVRETFLVLLAALTGGVVVKFLKLQPIIGYILAGVVFAALIPFRGVGIERLAEIGAILLLFSVGLELPLSRLARMLKTAVVGGGLQILILASVSFLFLQLFGFDSLTSLVLSLGFSLSSTAVVVKMLADRGETDSIHGELMISWLLFQDLAVVPMMIILPTLALSGGEWLSASLIAIAKAVVVVVGVVFVGRLVVPFLIHKVAALNSRELLIISAVTLALGTAALTSLLGISLVLGAFLAGMVISETQENHAVFAETRPLRDLFVAFFFVSLGFLLQPGVLTANFWLILSIVVFIFLLKFFVFMLISFILKYHGKTAVTASLGLSQVGEFAFIIFSQASVLKILSPEATSIGIAVALFTLLLTPICFKLSLPIWRRLRDLTAKWSGLHRFFVGWDRTHIEKDKYQDHVIICGFGRVGKWIGKALTSMKIPFVVIDYSHKVVQQAKKEGTATIYGDPSEMEVLEQADISRARALVIAIPDRVTQEELITKVQTVKPGVKIFSRAHYNEDWERLKFLKVDKVVQPEFEAALAITKAVLFSLGKPREEIRKRIKGLRLSHALKK